MITEKVCNLIDPSNSGFTVPTKEFLINVMQHPFTPIAVGCFALTAYVCYRKLQNVKPVLETSLNPSKNVKPISGFSLANFPKYLDRFMLDGTVHGGDEVYFPMSKEMELFPFKIYESLVEKLRPSLNKLIENKNEIIANESFERGVEISINSQCAKKCFYGVATKKLNNYKAALRHVENEVLSQKICKMSANEIEGAIKKTNYLLENGVLQEKIKLHVDELAKVLKISEVQKKAKCKELMELIGTPGEYRKDYITVAHGAKRIEQTPEGFKAAIFEKGGTKRDLENVDKFLDLKIGEDLPEDVRRSMELAFFIPNSPKELKGLMLEFAGKIKELVPKVIDRTLDAVEAASFVHQGIGNIHAFVDGHGRVARIWMNAMLQLGGYRAVAIHDKDGYMKATRDDRTSPGAFSKYLIKEIRWNQLQSVLNDPENI